METTNIGAAGIGMAVGQPACLTMASFASWCSP
jgi:hypothetical protein